MINFNTSDFKVTVTRAVVPSPNTSQCEMLWDMKCGHDKSWTNAALALFDSLIMINIS